MMPSVTTAKVTGVSEGTVTTKIKAKMAVKKANPAYTAQDYKVAAEQYEEALTNDPSMTDLYFFLGNSYDNLYRPAKKGDATNDSYLTKAVENYKKGAEQAQTASLAE